MNHAQIMRLIFIDERLADGRELLRRNTIQLRFNVGVAQSSNDLSLVQRLFPNRMTYDKRRKGYVATPGSAPIFRPEDHDAVWHMLQSIDEHFQWLHWAAEGLE